MKGKSAALTGGGKTAGERNQMKAWKKYGLAALIGTAALFCGAEASAESVLDRPYQNMEMHDVKTEGTLVFSDCPEYVQQTGVLAEGTIQGEGRIYYYHVNDTGMRTRLVVYAQSNQAADVRVTRFIQAVPSTDYVTSGETLSFSEMVAGNQTPLDIQLAPGKRTVVASEASSGMLPGYLYSGIVEVETKEPVKFGVAMLPMTGDLQGGLDAAGTVPADSHALRGTFPKTVYRENKNVWNTDAGVPQELIVGGNGSLPFYRGMDELDGTERENTGDYGTTLQIRIRTEGSKPYRIYFNPLGGVYMGSFKITQGFLPRYYRTDDMKYHGHQLGEETLDDYIDTGKWEAGKPVTIEFLAAGATYLPVRFLFVPEGA